MKGFYSEVAEITQSSLEKTMVSYTAAIDFIIYLQDVLLLSLLLSKAGNRRLLKRRKGIYP